MGKAVSRDWCGKEGERELAWAKRRTKRGNARPRARCLPPHNLPPPNPHPLPIQSLPPSRGETKRGVGGPHLH